MSSRSRGDWFEGVFKNLIEAEIQEGRFWAKADCCTVLSKQPYYSNDRKGDIEFDLAIEIRMPGAVDASLVVLIECKNYSTPVGVEDLEEFYSKAQQVTGLNTKAILATTSSFKRGALEFARSKKIGLVRYFSDQTLSWTLQRSASRIDTLTPKNQDNHDAPLLTDDFPPDLGGVYCLASTGNTYSLELFFKEHIEDGLPRKLQSVKSKNPERVRRVPFLSRDQIEACAASILAEFSHYSRTQKLDALVERARQVKELEVLWKPSIREDLLGEYIASNGTIIVYQQSPRNHGRERYTLAHELGHHYLEHFNFLSRDVVRASDQDVDSSVRLIQVPNLARMEWQANAFAACLLMPKHDVIRIVLAELSKLSIRQRSPTLLYVDHQPCNLATYMAITDRIKSAFGVSRRAASIRLEEIGILTDARGSEGGTSITNALLKGIA